MVQFSRLFREDRPFFEFTDFGEVLSGGGDGVSLWDGSMREERGDGVWITNHADMIDRKAGRIATSGCISWRRVCFVPSSRTTASESAQDEAFQGRSTIISTDERY
jgi:hypothetical protein